MTISTNLTWNLEILKSETKENHLQELKCHYVKVYPSNKPTFQMYLIIVLFVFPQ